MLAIRCIRCHRRLFSAAKPRPGVRCPVCGGELRGRAHRAAWVEDTGELALVQLGPAVEGGGHVEILGTFADRTELDRELDGWRERCGRRGSAEWLRERSGAAAAA